VRVSSWGRGGRGGGENCKERPQTPSEKPRYLAAYSRTSRAHPVAPSPRPATGTGIWLVICLGPNAASVALNFGSTMAGRGLGSG
jgi:hypothetical protein